MNVESIVQNTTVLPTLISRIYSTRHGEALFLIFLGTQGASSQPSQASPCG